MLKEDGRPLFPAKGRFLDEGLLLALDLQVSAAMDGMLSHRFFLEHDASLSQRHVTFFSTGFEIPSDVLIETWEEKVLSSKSRPALKGTSYDMR